MTLHTNLRDCRRTRARHLSHDGPRGSRADDVQGATRRHRRTPPRDPQGVAGGGQRRARQRRGDPSQRRARRQRRPRAPHARARRPRPAGPPARRRRPEATGPRPLAAT